MDVEEIYDQYPTRSDCVRRLEEIRWPDGPVCPYCKSKRATAYKGSDRHHCNSCTTSYSVTVGTVFHRARLDLQKWFAAVALIMDTGGDISARKLSRDLKISKDTACRIRLKIIVALHDPAGRRLLLNLAPHPHA